MNLKNCQYMKSAEFKVRQMWLEFEDAVGIVLEIMSKKIKELKLFIPFSYCKKTPQKKEKQKQLNLEFIRNVKEWAEWTKEKKKTFSFEEAKA